MWPTWVWDQLLEHRQPTSGHVPKGKRLSGPQQPSTVNRSSTTSGTSGAPPPPHWAFARLDLVLVTTPAVSCCVQWPWHARKPWFPISPSRSPALTSFPQYPLSFGWKEVNIIDSSTAEHTRLFLSDFDEL